MLTNSRVRLSAWWQRFCSSNDLKAAAMLKKFDQNCDLEAAGAPPAAEGPAAAQEQRPRCVAFALQVIVLLLLQQSLSRLHTALTPVHVLAEPRSTSRSDDAHDRRWGRREARAQQRSSRAARDQALEQMRLEPAVARSVVCRTFRSATGRQLLEELVARELNAVGKDCGDEACHRPLHRPTTPDTSSSPRPPS